MLLLFPKNIGRLSFAIRNVVLNVLVWPLIMFFEAGPAGEGPTNALWVWSFGASVVAYWLLFVALPRCRDAGLPRWIVLLLLVPVVNFGVALILLGTGTKLAIVDRITPPPLPAPISSTQELPS